MLKYAASKPLFRSRGLRTPFSSALLHSWSAVLLLMIFSALPAPALAQEFSIDELEKISDADDRQSDWQSQAGGLLIYWPEYIGSDEFEALAFPLFVVEYKRLFFLHYIDGVGVYLLNDGNLKLSTSVAYAIGREESDSQLLDGLGDIDAGATINVFGEHRGEHYSFGAKFINQISGDDTGFIVDLDAGYTASFAGKLALKYGVIASYASSEYMEQYFGISAVQSLASGRDRYTADAGFKTAGVLVNSVYFLPNNWNIQAQLKYERLLGDVADSPVAQDENQYTLALGFGHQF